ncbi:MAG: hypothetical protein ACOYI4_09170 [Christensenellales bacterium]|jgi:hypothetical protein
MKIICGRRWWGIVDAMGIFLSALRNKQYLIPVLQELDPSEVERGRLCVSQRLLDLVLPAAAPWLPQIIREVSVQLGQDELVVDLCLRMLGKRARMRYVCQVETMDFSPCKHRVLLRYQEEMLSGPALVNKAVRTLVRRSWLQMLLKAPGLHLTKTMLSVDLQQIPGFSDWLQRSGLGNLVVSFGGLEIGRIVLLWKWAEGF